ncbi:MAG: hypothetical protein KGI26_04040 [Thaumarchaeota archaeon]|nr:hypothetical protein [Nitrososphaerota archaeon]
MPRLLGVEMSGGKLALRVVLAVVFGSLAALFLAYLPSAAGSFAKQAAGTANAAAVESIVNALINPSLPAVGAVVAALVFLGFLLRGTKVYGPILMVLGLALLAYVYLAFQGGTIGLTIPQGLQYAASGSVSIGVSTLMLLFMVAPLLTLVKGLVLTVMKSGESPPVA